MWCGQLLVAALESIAGCCGAGGGPVAPPPHQVLPLSASPTQLVLTGPGYFVKLRVRGQDR